jgi:error-prone DNA polymerase
MDKQNYIELQVTTHFSFLRGASSCEELFVQAAALEIPALGITDRNSLAGIVRAHEAAKVSGTRLIVGCRLDLEDFSSILIYPTDRASYGRLCRLLTVGKARAGKGKCALAFKDLTEWCQGLIGILVTDKPHETLAEELGKFRNAFGDRAYCGLPSDKPFQNISSCRLSCSATRAARRPARS